jgi:hypothetical protein
MLCQVTGKFVLLLTSCNLFSHLVQLLYNLLIAQAIFALEARYFPMVAPWHRNTDLPGHKHASADIIHHLYTQVSSGFSNAFFITIITDDSIKWFVKAKTKTETKRNNTTYLPRTRRRTILLNKRKNPQITRMRMPPKIIRNIQQSPRPRRKRLDLIRADLP